MAPSAWLVCLALLESVSSFTTLPASTSSAQTATPVNSTAVANTSVYEPLIVVDAGTTLSTANVPALHLDAFLLSSEPSTKHLGHTVSAYNHNIWVGFDRYGLGSWRNDLGWRFYMDGASQLTVDPAPASNVVALANDMGLCAHWDQFVQCWVSDPVARHWISSELLEAPNATEGNHFISAADFTAAFSFHNGTLAITTNLTATGSVGRTILMFELDTTVLDLRPLPQGVTLSWNHAHTLSTSMEDSYGVAIAMEDDVLFVGCPQCNDGHGVVELWVKRDQSWHWKGDILGSPYSTGSVSTGVELFGTRVVYKKNAVAVTGPATFGSVHVFTVVNQSVVHQCSFTDPWAGSNFGLSLDLDVDRFGHILVTVGAPGLVRAWVFLVKPGSPASCQPLALFHEWVSVSDSFGWAVGLGGGYLFVGIPHIFSKAGRLGSAAFCFPNQKLQFVHGRNWRWDCFDCPEGQISTGGRSSDCFCDTSKLDSSEVFLSSSCEVGCQLGFGYLPQTTTEPAATTTAWATPLPQHSNVSDGTTTVAPTVAAGTTTVASTTVSSSPANSTTTNHSTANGTTNSTANDTTASSNTEPSTSSVGSTAAAAATTTPAATNMPTATSTVSNNSTALRCVACTEFTSKPTHSHWTSQCGFECELGYFGQACRNCSASMGVAPPAHASWTDGAANCTWECEPNWEKNLELGACCPAQAPANAVNGSNSLLCNWDCFNGTLFNTSSMQCDPCPFPARAHSEWLSNCNSRCLANYTEYNGTCVFSGHPRPPLVSSPIIAGQAFVEGNSSQPRNSIVMVYINHVPIGSCRVSATGHWILDNLPSTLLRSQDLVVARVKHFFLDYLSKLSNEVHVRPRPTTTPSPTTTPPTTTPGATTTDPSPTNGSVGNESTANETVGNTTATAPGTTPMPQTTTAPLPPPTIDTPLHAEATLITGTVAMTGTVWIHVDHAAVGVVHVVAGFNQTGWLTWSYKASPALLRQGDVVFAVLDVFPRVSVPSVSVVVSAVLPDPPTVTGPIYAFASVVHGTFDGVINVGTLVTVYAQGYAIGGADVESRSWSVAIAQNISHLLVVGAAVHATITNPHGNVTSSRSKVVYVEQAPTTTPMPATTTPVAPTTINCEYVDCPNSTHCVVIDPCPGNMACLALPYTTCQPDHTSSAAPTTTTTTAAAPTTVAAGTTPCHGFGCIDVQLPDPGLFTSSAAAATTVAPTETESATTAASVEGSTAVPATTATPAPTTVGLSLQPYEPNIGVVHFGDYAEMAITLSIDYATVAGSPSLASSFVEVLESDISHASLNKALPVTRRLAPGSVVATVHVFAADGHELKAVAEDIVDQAADPNSLLKQGILTRAITSVVITRYAKVNPPLSPTPTSKPSEGSSPPINRNGIAIIVAAVVVLAAVVSTIVFVTRRRRRAAQRERYVDGAQPANVFTEVGPDGMVRRPSERPLMDVTPVAHRQPSAPLPGDEADLAHMKRLAQAAAVGIAGAAAEGGEDLEYMKARAAAKNQALEEDGEPDFANFEFQRGELRLRGKAAAAEDTDFSNFDFSQGEGGQPKGSVRYQVSSNIEAELEDGTVAGLGPRDVDIEMSSLEPTSLTTRPMAGVSVLSDVVALQSHSVGGEQSLQTRTMASLPTASGADSDQEAEVETPPGTPPTGEE